jgi:hypothetical protein
LVWKKRETIRTILFAVTDSTQFSRLVIQKSLLQFTRGVHHKGAFTNVGFFQPLGGGEKSMGRAGRWGWSEPDFL